MTGYDVVEICAGAGGQALGLETAGFSHAIAVEMDRHACQTLRENRDWLVAEGDVADHDTWNPADFVQVDLLAGGVPCPPFSIAGKQLGASDERDLFAWAIELIATVRPRALMLENVRGLSTPRFAAYRQRVLDRLVEFGYVADWRLLHASDFGVPQLRPRFVLVALQPEDAAHFHWPQTVDLSQTVGQSLAGLMGEHGWRHLNDWEELASGVAPTLVGGSKKHGGADLGPTRAKLAWKQLGVDGMGIADDAPGKDAPHPSVKQPRLTIDMVARLQGWSGDDWIFSGGKTARYRQIGNAFPPPVAQAVGASIISAFNRESAMREIPELAEPNAHDEVYSILRRSSDFISADFITRNCAGIDIVALERRIAHLSRDFVVDMVQRNGGIAYRLGDFKGFVGRNDHQR